MYSGLSTKEAEKLLRKNGLNEIPQKKSTIFSRIKKNLISPISIMLVIAATLSFFVGKIFDGFFILFLLFLNIVITIWQEKKADNAIDKLNQKLEQKIKTLRNNKWTHTEARFLVPGDVVKIGSGEVIPADGVILEADYFEVNESAVTGESLPKGKSVYDTVFSGTVVEVGIAVFKVLATGVNTSFGKTIFSVERVRKHSILEKDILNLSKFLTTLSLIAVVVLTLILLLNNAPFLEILTLNLSLIIAGIPISLPTVMTLIIEFGVLDLVKKNVIVRRLSSLEDLANVNFLLTDKTGTLTKNKITVSDVYAYDGFTHNDVLEYASIFSEFETENSINQAISEKLESLKLKKFEFEKLDFIPADSDRKRSTLKIKKDGKNLTLTLGAPRVVSGFLRFDSEIKKKFDREIDTLAISGYRALTLAISKGDGEKDMKIVGLIALSDTLRDDAKQVIGFLKENGVGVSMVTGDSRAISAEIAKELGFSSQAVLTKKEFDKLSEEKLSGQFYQRTQVFAEIFPEDKLKLAKYAKKFFVVAQTGDGVNDLPALKMANVGIAVKNAVSSLKATADIVLLSEGISVIKDAIIESRKIFERIYTYSLYRISESFRLIISIFILGVLFGQFPLTALQIILIALLNDIPIISLAFDRVKIPKSPSKLDTKNRLILGALFGAVGVLSSIIFFIIIHNYLKLSWEIIQTAFFLKLIVSGHLLIYVAHTKKHWWKFLPSKEVIFATLTTQLLATLIAFTGFLMPAKLSLVQIVFIWLWAIAWIQVSEIMKIIQPKLRNIR